MEKAIKDAGIAANYTTADLQLLIDIMSADLKTSMDNFKNQVVNLSKMLELKQGDTITKEQYNKLSVEA